MFRDESNKVMKKAHAQWGGASEVSEQGDSSGSSPDSASPSSARSRSSAPEATIPPPSTTVTTSSRKTSAGKRLIKEICATPVDKGIQFYIEHYVIGLPDEPRAGHELQGVKWVHSRATRDIIAAVGMAGLSNLTGDNEMGTLSRYHYGLALHNVASSVRDPKSLELDLVMRIVVMMAMYEVSYRCQKW
jgi:hypothetical protein